MLKMKSMRLLQREALRQIFSPQPRTRLSQSTFRQICFNSQATFRTRPLKPSTPCPRSPLSPLRSQVKLSNASRTFRRFQSVQVNTSDASLSLSQRLRKLSREYGWTAVGVYLALSALDFPFCFLAVKLLGTDRIGHWEHVVLSYVKGLIKWPLGQGGQDAVDGAINEVKRVGKETLPLGEGQEDGQKRILEQEPTYIVDDHGYQEAEKANKGENASMLHPSTPQFMQMGKC
jgi:Protein of unknown function (DUF1279)